MSGAPLPAIAESPAYLALIRETRGQHQDEEALDVLQFSPWNLPSPGQEQCAKSIMSGRTEVDPTERPRSRHRRICAPEQIEDAANRG